MVAAMDAVGNPSSVHAEGRAAKAVVERARAQVADLVGCLPNQVVFTASATEAAALACDGKGVACSDVEHDAVHEHQFDPLDADQDGTIYCDTVNGNVLAIQAANSETGICQNMARFTDLIEETTSSHFLIDAVQAVGKQRFHAADARADFVLVSAHKFGGPKGAGALCLRDGLDVEALIHGGGQEMGRRAGTENVIGIAGFGAAAEAAKRDVDAGRWDRVEKLRNILESALEAPEYDTIFVGKGVPRLPNTSCILTPGWKGETQVMQMDLAGFAISAGSACSSGKVKASRVLRAMGYSHSEASSAIRVSLGLETTEDDVVRFAEAWSAARKKHKARAA